MSKKRSFIINTLIIIILLVLLALFYFARFAPLFRFWYSLKVFALDITNYFVVLFTGENIEYLRLFDILKAAPDIDLPSIPLPEASESFSLQFTTFFKLFINLDNFKVRMYGSLKILILLAQSIQIVIIIYLLLKLIFSNYFDYNDLSFNHKSKPLKVYQLLVKKVFVPIFNFLRDVLLTVRHRTIYSLAFLILLGLHLNLFAIVLDIIGFLFYLTSTFDFVSTYHFVFVLLLTLEPLVKYVPFPIWFYLAFVLFRRWQYKLAIERLYHYDSMNKGLLKSLGVVINFKGPPGGGKTTMMTDAGLNFDEIFKTEFNNTLREFQSYFPDFPFNEFEIYLRRLISEGVIQNRHFVKIVVGRIFYEYEESHVFPFSYDLEIQKTYVSIGNKLVFIQDALITYGEAFYYYSYDASLIAGNLSIRYDFELVDDQLHYPQWNYNAFTIDPLEAYEKTRYSKSIDFDSMRLHKKIRYDEEHPIMDVGVLLETEAAKQWGNQYDNSIYKKDDEAANPLNDGFVDFLSTFRHGSLINYQPYMRYLQDYQRKGDMQSKIGELAETSINIFSDNKREIMTLPFFFYTPLVLEFLVNKWDEFYLSKYRINRSDRTLLFYLINQIGSWANRYLITQRNKFVVLEKNIVTNLGSDDSNLTETKQRSYYFIIKKIYANRFASDALKRFFDSGDNVEGFKALKDYEGLYPSEQELLAQNSYFNNKRLRSNSVAEQQDDGPLF